MSLNILHQKFGAQILQVSPCNIFYISPKNLPSDLSNLDSKEVVHRGGIPILFPQFADRGKLTKHGFVRNVNWDLISKTTNGNIEVIEYQLVINKGDQSSWPYSAKLIYQVEHNSFSNEISAKLSIENTGDEMFTWTGGLHPYFALDDLETTKVQGLQNYSVENRYDASKVKQEDEFVTFSEDVYECLFIKPVESTTNPTNSSVKIITNSRVINISSVNFDNWMVWNPGKEGAKALSDMPSDEWNKFVCVEPVIVSSPKEIKPGETFSGQMNINIESVYPLRNIIS